MNDYLMILVMAVISSHVVGRTVYMFKPKWILYIIQFITPIFVYWRGGEPSDLDGILAFILIVQFVISGIMIFAVVVSSIGRSYDDPTMLWFLFYDSASEDDICGIIYHDVTKKIHSIKYSDKIESHIKKTIENCPETYIKPSVKSFEEIKELFFTSKVICEDYIRHNIRSIIVRIDEPEEFFRFVHRRGLLKTPY